MQDLQSLFENAFSGFGITDAVDIIIVSIVVYYLLKLIVQTRAIQILKGILVLVAALVLSEIFDLHTLNWMCKGAVAMGAVAILIVFQPELRRALELMGRGKIVSGLAPQGDKENHKKNVSEVVKAVEILSKDKTGALIVFERETVLEDISETGTILNAQISEPLIGNIFYEGSPLHDGAIIINTEGIYAAGCVLPLSRQRDLNKKLGTRHRAGIGITENSDALVVIVSEETGIISMAEDGKLDRFLDVKTVEKRLLNMYVSDNEIGGRFSNIPVLGKMFSRLNQQNEVTDKLIVNPGKTDDRKEEENAEE